MRFKIFVFLLFAVPIFNGAYASVIESKVLRSRVTLSGELGKAGNEHIQLKLAPAFELAADTIVIPATALPLKEGVLYKDLLINGGTVLLESGILRVVTDQPEVLIPPTMF